MVSCLQRVRVDHRSMLLVAQSLAVPTIEPWLALADLLLERPPCRIHTLSGDFNDGKEAPHPFHARGLGSVPAEGVVDALLRVVSEDDIYSLTRPGTSWQVIA